MMISTQASHRLAEVWVDQRQHRMSGTAFSSEEVMPQSGRTTREPWCSAKIGFIGTEIGYEVLSPEVHTLVLSRVNLDAALQEGHLEAVVLEPGFLGLLPVELDCFVPDLRHEATQRAIRAVRDEGVPLILWLRMGPNLVDYFSEHIHLFDAVVCNDPRAAALLDDFHVNVHFLSRPIASGQTNAFTSLEASQAAPLRTVSGDLSWVLGHAAAHDVVQALVGETGLKLFSVDVDVRDKRLSDLQPALRKGVIGCVGRQAGLDLVRRSEVNVIFGFDRSADFRSVERAVEAAACRTVPVFVSDDDHLRMMLQPHAVVASTSEAVQAVGRFLDNRDEFNSTVQPRWREVHRSRGSAMFVKQILALVGVGTTPPEYKATVVTPTYRPTLLNKVVQQFRQQTYPHKELVVVANTDHPRDWDTSVLDHQAGERLLFLSRECWAGTALNVGALEAKGDYVFRMDDDDHYGRYYLEDLMLGISATHCDLIGKDTEYYYFEGIEKVFRRTKATAQPLVFSSRDLGRKSGAHLAGFSIGVRRELAIGELRYPDSAYGFADTALLRLASEKDLLCAKSDSTNAVVERRGDLSSHTWQEELRHDSPHFQSSRLSLSEVTSM